MNKKTPPDEICIKVKMVKVTIVVEYDYRNTSTGKPKQVRMTVHDSGYYSTEWVDLVNDRCEFTVTQDFDVIYLGGPGFYARYPKQGFIEGGIAHDTTFIFCVSDHDCDPALIIGDEKKPDDVC